MNLAGYFDNKKDRMDQYVAQQYLTKLKQQKITCLGFSVQIVREMDVDCALAEMYVRGLATEELIKKQHESEIFNSLYSRLNEVSLIIVHSNNLGNIKS